MSNPLIDLIRQGASFIVAFNPYGEPRSITIFSRDLTTSVSSQNEHFSMLFEFLESSGNKTIPNIQWVAPVYDKFGTLLYYQTNLGDFVASSNYVTDHIEKSLKSQRVEVREANKQPIVEVEISVFLPRRYTLYSDANTRIEQFAFHTEGLNLPFPSQVHLLSAIEPDYFTDHELIRKNIKNFDGNVIRLTLDRRVIHKVFNWSKGFIGSDLALLQESISENIALHKRTPSQGPTTNWYFDWLVLQSYIWAPTLEAANKLIGLLNCQAHRKTTAFFSRDDLGDNVCIRARNENGSSSLWHLSSLRDEQISIFPSELGWNYPPIHHSFHRVRFLVDRGLYFEAIVVAQAVLEGLINAMFTPEIRQVCFQDKEQKWEVKYRLIKRFISELDNGHFLKQSTLNRYLNGGLKRVYELRNKYAHDIFENQPDYVYQGHLQAEIVKLLRPMTDSWEVNLFLREIDAMYGLNERFKVFLMATGRGGTVGEKSPEKGADV